MGNNSEINENNKRAGDAVTTEVLIQKYQVHERTALMLKSLLDN